MIFYIFCGRILRYYVLNYLEVEIVPNIKSAKKRVKVIEKKTLINQMHKTALKTAIKKFAKSAVKDGGGDEKGLRKILESHIDENRVRSSDIQFGLVTFNATKMQPVEVMTTEIPHGELIDYMIICLGLT